MPDSVNRPAHSSRALRIGIVVGEASGDMLGASLIKAIRKHHPDAEFEGIGGPLMNALGFNSLFPMERLSVMGFVEPLKRLPELFRIKAGLVEHFSTRKPDVFIGIDSPDFNLRVERPLKEQGILTVHYVSPSVWAWRQGRVKGIRKAVDMVLCLLPFEADFYERETVPVRFVGHPMADEIDIEPRKLDFRQRLNISPDNPAGPQHRLIALLPGSRSGEIEKIAPTLVEVADRLIASDQSTQFLIPAASDKLKAQLEPIIGDRASIKIVDGMARDVLGAADAAIVASGTATLEAMLMKCPMVVAYKVDAFTYFIGKMLVKTEFISLANLVAGEALVNERIQHEASVEALVADLNKLINTDAGQRQVELFHQHHQRLRRNASESAANAVLELISDRGAG